MEKKVTWVNPWGTPILYYAYLKYDNKNINHSENITLKSTFRHLYYLGLLWKVVTKSKQ